MQGRTPIIIKDFTGGINKFVDAIKLKKNEFVQFSNLIILSFGFYFDAVKRDSIRRYNSNTPTLSATKITALYEFAQNRKSTNTYLITNTDKGIDSCVGTGVFTNRINSANTGKARFLTYNDNLYITGRNNAGVDLVNNVWDGTTFTEIGTPPCTQNFTLTEIPAPSGGSLGDGNPYYYIITFTYDNNEESSYILPNASGTEKDSADGFNRPIVSYTSQNITLSTTGKAVLISNIPIGNGRVTARNIYRTEIGGTDYYKVTTLQNNTETSYIDNTQDASLGDELSVDYIFKPLISRYICTHKERVYKAYSTENEYAMLAIEAPPTTFTPSSSSGGLTIATAAQTTIGYKYKFATMGFVTATFSPLTTASRSALTGFFGQLTVAFSATLNYNGGGGAEDNTITITGITPAETWIQRVAIFRNVSKIITGVSIASQAVLTVGTGNGYLFKVGETVAVSGITGTTMPNGSYLVTAVSDTTVTINFNSTGGTYTSGGNLQGGTYYYAGNTGINRGSFVDKINDTDLVGYQSEVRNFEYFNNGNSTYGSLVEYSEIEQGDIYPSLNQISVNPDDNDVITGIFNEPDGVVIFKERGIYKLYTASSNPENWELQRLVFGIGATEPYSIVQLPDYSYIFLSNKTFYTWKSGTITARRISDNIQTDLNLLAFTNIDSCFDSKRNWVWITYSVNGTIGNLLIYDLNLIGDSGVGKWYHFKKNSGDLGVRYPAFTKLSKVLFASDYNRIMAYGEDSDSRDETGSGWSNEEIKTILQTKVFDGNKTNFKKLLAKIFATNGDTVTVKVNVDGAETTEGSPTASATGYSRIEVPINKGGNRIYAQIETTTTNPFALQLLTIHSLDEHGDNNKQIDTADYGD